MGRAELEGVEPVGVPLVSETTNGSLLHHQLGHSAFLVGEVYICIFTLSLSLCSRGLRLIRGCSTHMLSQPS